MTLDREHSPEEVVGDVLKRREFEKENSTLSTHHLEINGINVHYQTWGEFTRPERTVLLVHGLTASSQEWAQLGPILAEQGWYAVAPDLRGRGLEREAAAWLWYSLSRQRPALAL